MMQFRILTSARLLEVNYGYNHAYEKINQKNIALALCLKILNLVLVTLVVFLSCGLYQQAHAQSHLDIEKKPEIFYNSTGKYYEVHHGTPSGDVSLILPESNLLFNVIPLTENSTVVSFDMTLKPELAGVYKQIGFQNKSGNIVFVYPVFTQAAYGKGGFYDYYNKKCDATCLTVPIPTSFDGTYSSSIVGAYVLNLLNYSFVTDADVDKNPGILQKYDTVIMLHNEYVTQNEFNAVTQHPHVIYLYPNALFAQVRSNYTDDTITLVKGHGYPDVTVQNGFDWKNDNTRFEYDLQCKGWNFTGVDNGKMLDCYPDYAVLYDEKMLSYIKEQGMLSIPEFYSVTGIVMVLGIVMVISVNKLKINNIA